MTAAEASRGVERLRTVLRFILAAAFLAAGAAHLLAPAGFLLITPDWVPYPRQVIFWTGIAEIAGALALFHPRLRRWAGAGLALYAVCVFPANVKHALESVPVGGTQLGWGYHGPRLAFQPVIVWWALFAGGLVTWPFRGKSRAGRSGRRLVAGPDMGE
jgi:uncharacterized membrane protein